MRQVNFELVRVTERHCLNDGTCNAGPEITTAFHHPPPSVALYDGEFSPTKSPFTNMLSTTCWSRRTPLPPSIKQTKTHTTLSLSNPSGHATQMQQKYVGSNNSQQWNHLTLWPILDISLSQGGQRCVEAVHKGMVRAVDDNLTVVTILIQSLFTLRRVSSTLCSAVTSVPLSLHCPMSTVTAASAVPPGFRHTPACADQPSEQLVLRICCSCLFLPPPSQPLYLCCNLFTN